MINNAVKYSNAGEIRFEVEFTDNILNTVVADNGIGFDETINKGNGLDNIQKRAQQIGAEIIIESKHNEGSRVAMQLKIT